MVAPSITTPVTLGAGVVRHGARLADGRELLFYDDADTRLGPDRLVDRRALDPRPATATMRQDVLTGDWISVAAARQHRAFLPPAEFDPLAPQSEHNPSEIPDDYDVAVFENRSPSFGPALVGAPGASDTGVDAPTGLDDLDRLGMERSRSAVGRCEVVCFSPDRAGSLGTQPTSRVRTVIEAWADRTAALSTAPGVEQVFCFENRGEAIGVTLHHPHGQVYAYPYVTPSTRRTLDTVSRYHGDLFEDVLRSEAAGPRVLADAEHWLAFVPFAARWPLEAHLLPKRHVPDLAATSEAERVELAVLLPRLLRGVDAVYDSPTPYIAAWHQAPVRIGRERIRLSLRVTSPRRAAERLKYLAGSESAMGAWIGDVPPEVAAEQLRDGMARADATLANGAGR